jgi:protease PrsW
MVYPIYLLFLGSAPGLIWLFYFLRKDDHPEPKRMILKIFFYGMAVALPAALIELLLQKIILKNYFSQQILENAFFLFSQAVIGVALVEEGLKFLVIKFNILRHPEMDEPVDVLLYMIVAALGFATMENLFIFLSPDMFSYPLRETFALAVFRFISATFLHALCSGTIGFFLALSFCKIKNKRLLFAAGFLGAVLLHGLYNFSIINLEGNLRFGVPIAIIAILAIFIYFGIKYLKSIKSICKIQ